MSNGKHPLTDEAIAEFFPADDTPEGRAELRRQFDAMMAEREATRLSACPFCGGTAYLDTGFGPSARVGCGDCGVMTPWHTGPGCEEAARAAWNRRARQTGGAHARCEGE